MRTVALSLLGLAALGTLSVSFAPGTARAQGLQGQVISCEFQNTDVREALRYVFKNTQASFTIAPDVQGTVTLALSNVPLETALQNITRQVGANYKITNGVIMVTKEGEATIPATMTRSGGFPSVAQGAASSDSIMLSDENYLYILKGATVWKIGKSSLSIERKLNLNAN